MSDQSLQKQVPAQFLTIALHHPDRYAIMRAALLKSVSAHLENSSENRNSGRG